MKTTKAQKQAKQLVNEIGYILFDKDHSISKPLVKDIGLIVIEKMMKIEQKYSNFGEYDWLQEVKKEIEKL